MQRASRDLLDQLRRLLRASASIVGHPVGSNGQLADLLKRIAVAVEAAGDISEDELIARISGKLERPNAAAPPPPVKVARDYRRLSLEDVEDFIENDEITRNELIEIARDRFSAPVGSLKRFSREILRDRLRALVADERSHDALARLASGQGQLEPAAPKEAPKGSEPVPTDAAQLPLAADGGFVAPSGRPSARRS